MPEHDASLPADAGAAQGPDPDQRLARRRRLLRAAAAGSPLMLSLPTRAAGPIGSAYRGAINDAIHPPLLAVASADGWIRVAGTRFTGTYSLAADVGVPPLQYTGQLYRIEGVWYDTSGALAVPVSGIEEPVFLAVLFATTFTPGSGSATELGAWPRYVGAGQALHLSSWSSLSPTGSQGPGWVVG